MTDTTGTLVAIDPLRRTRRLLIAGLLGVAATLGAATFALFGTFQPVGTVANPTDATGLTWVRSIYGWGKAANQQLAGPQGIAVAPDGTIWTTDQSQSRVMGFHPDGSYAGMLYQGDRTNPHQPDAFKFPTSVAVAPDGTIYVGDQAGNRVYAMSADNKVLARISVPLPSAVAASNDRLVVGSSSGFVIMSRTGSVLKVLGTQGTGDTQFQGVRGVAIGHDGTIYVADQYNNRVSAYDTNGKRLWIHQTGAPGNKTTPKNTTSPNATAAAGLQLPAGLTLDGAGRLVVADPFGFDLAVLDPKTGKIVTTYGEAGAQDGAFIYPSGVAYDAGRDWYAVADTMNGRVQIVRLPGSGGTATAAVARSLSGVWRAALVPLLLILIFTVGALGYRRVRRLPQRKEGRENEENGDELA